MFDNRNWSSFWSILINLFGILDKLAKMMLWCCHEFLQKEHTCWFCLVIGFISSHLGFSHWNGSPHFLEERLEIQSAAKKDWQNIHTAKRSQMHQSINKNMQWNVYKKIYIYISSPKTNGLNPPKIGCFADVSPFLPRRVHFQGACVLLFPVVFLTNIRFLKSLKRGKKSGSWCFKPESCSCSYCRWVVGSALVVPVVGPSNTKYRSPMTADHWWELRLQRWQLRQKRNGGKMVCRFFFFLGCLQKGMEMLVFMVWRGALLTFFWKLLSFFLTWCVFFFVWVYFVALFGH